MGRGPLTWNRNERRSDRYGCVYCHAISSAETPLELVELAYMYEETIKKYSGQKGKLTAEIVQTRKSSHVGDLFRGIFPHTPSVGDLIELGNGTLFFETTPGEYFGVGLLPDDNRETDWLNPQHLYNCHDQTVKLFFYPEGGIS